MTATASVRQIQPGEAAFIEVVLDARRLSGNRSMSIYVDFGNDYISTATLSISANFYESNP